MAVQSFCIIYFQGKRIGKILESESLKKTLENHPDVRVLRWTTFDQSTIERAAASYPQRCVPFRWVCQTSTLRDAYPSHGYVKHPDRIVPSRRVCQTRTMRDLFFATKFFRNEGCLRKSEYWLFIKKVSTCNRYHRN